MSDLFRYTIFLYVLASMISFTSCKKEQTEDTSEQNIIFSEDGKLVRGKIATNFSNEDCGKINITTAIQEDDMNHSTLSLSILTNGAIAGAKLYIRHPSNSDIYYAPFMEAGKYFKIEDFHYDPITKDLSFHFDGTVFLDSLKSKKINGRVQAKSVKQNPCSAHIFDVRTLSNNFQFSSISSDISRHISAPTPPNYQNVTYNTRSTTGQLLRLQLETDFSQLVNKEVDFSSEDDSYRVVYAEYNGPMSLNGGYGSTDTRYWKYYQTKGTLRVDGTLNQEQKNQKPLYQGIIFMDLLENGKIVQEGIEMPFVGL